MQKANGRDRSLVKLRLPFIGALLLLSSLAVSACDSITPAEKANGDGQQIPLTSEAARQAALELLASQERKTYDDHLAEIALATPGYAGHYLDTEQRLHVLSTSHSGSAGKADAALGSALQGQLSERGFTEVATEGATVHSAQFDFLQLYVWRIALRKSVLGLEGVTALDIDEVNNNIRIGVENLAFRDEVLSAVKGLGLPQTAIVIEEVAPVRRTGFSIQNRTTRLVAGLQIEYSAPGVSGRGPCTLGPAVEVGGHKGFIVNSHCTGIQLGLNNASFYQADRGDTKMATEHIDPPGFTGGECPTGRRCAYADAAFAKWVSNGTNHNLGKIVRTKGEPSRTSGTTDMIFSEFNVTVTSFPNIGSRVYKIGRTTGWTYGYVSNTCADSNVAETNIRLLCQVVADYGSDYGDSGSPVFSWNGSGSNVALLGIHWGRNFSNNTSVFSTLQAVGVHLESYVRYH